MIEKSKSPHTYSPENLGDLLSLYKSMPDALVYGGGTYILKNQKREFLSLPENVIYLKRVEELNRISRTERFLEIGSSISINRVLSIGKHILPAALYNCLLGVGTPGIRNLATLGGNICVRDRRMDTFPLLHLLDARVELRKAGGSRWIQINRLFDSEGKASLQPGEILTRIRIPFDEWNVQVYHKLGSRAREGETTLSFCGLAKTQKGVINDIRIAYGCLGKQILRNREIEAELSGLKVPINIKDTASAMELLKENMDKIGIAISNFQKKRAVSFLRLFLLRLAEV
ncbi:MAG: molybdopterin dehydrogenase [Spirochaetes bacterium]|nr:MAG: molybdopterin dehydrogenase [Spirochaetota bacterium]